MDELNLELLPEDVRKTIHASLGFGDLLQNGPNKSVSTVSDSFTGVPPIPGYQPAKQVPYRAPYQSPLPKQYTPDLLDQIKAIPGKFMDQVGAVSRNVLNSMAEYEKENPLGSAQQAMIGGLGAVGFPAAKAAGRVLNNRFEFSEAGAKLKALPRALQESKLDDVLEYPELFNQYPDLKQLPVQKMIPTLNNAEKGGEFLGDKIRVRGNRPDADVLETLKHEIQHVIQNKEKWPLDELEAVQRKPRSWEVIAAELEELKS